MHRWLVVFLAVSAVAQTRVSSRAFEAKAFPALPVEESYDFLRQHSEGLPPRPRDPLAKPGPAEMEIGAGWTIRITTGASLPLQTAAEELNRYLVVAMNVQNHVGRVAAISDWQSQSKVIVAGARSAMPG